MNKFLIFFVIVFSFASCGVNESEEHKASREFYESVQKNIQGSWTGDKNPKKIVFTGNRFQWTEMDGVEWNGNWVVGRQHRNIVFTFDQERGQTYTKLEGEITSFDENQMTINCNDINFNSKNFKK